MEKKNAGVAVSARGTSRGLATLQTEDKFLLKRSYSTQHWIYAKLQHLPSKISLALFNVYVPVNYIEKNVCQKSLSDFMEIHSPTNITVVGDLNIILDPKEKKGGDWGKDPFQDLVESLIHDRDLLEFKPKKGRFTWTNNRIGAIGISGSKLFD